jgi:hypothetical protein
MTWKMKEFRDALAADIVNSWTEDLPAVAWNPEGYDAATGAFAIMVENFAQTPEKQIQIRDYPVLDGRADDEDVVGIQFSIRGGTDPDEVSDVIDGLFALFHDLWSVTIGPVKVVKSNRQSGANLGPDGSGRVSRTENYYFTVNRPLANRAI